MTQVDFPYRFDTRGRTASATDEEHVRQLIEQVLFTSIGERVNRPTFGSNLMQLVFAPASDEVGTVTQFLVQGALQQWVGDLIHLDSVDVELLESTIEVTVVYRLRQTGVQETATFSRTLT
jgi:phage baseplate assembly protein W